MQCDAVDSDGALYPSSATTYDVSAIDGTTVDVACNNQSNLIDNGNVTCARELFVAMRTLSLCSVRSRTIEVLLLLLRRTYGPLISPQLQERRL